MIKKAAVLVGMVAAAVLAAQSSGIKMSGLSPKVAPKFAPPHRIVEPPMSQEPIFSPLILNSPGDTVGTTVYDVQNWSPARRIAIDKDGNVHHCWMYSGQNSPYNDRAIYYNFWHNGSFELGGGVKASGSLRAGYGTIGVLPDGRAVCAFHDGSDGAKYRVSVTVDAGQGLGLFSAPVDVDTTTIVPENERGPLWPKMAIGPTGTIHIEAHPMDTTGGWCYHGFYSRSTDNGATFSPWHDLGSDIRGEAEIAVSKTSQKVAIVTLRSLYGDVLNDVVLYESNDNGATWASKTITSYAQPPYDTTLMYFGAFDGDVDVVYDAADKPHVVFTEVLANVSSSGWRCIPWEFNRVFHWSEATGFSIVSGLGTARADTFPNRDDTLKLWGFNGNLWPNNFEWRGACSKPQLAVGAGDTLYCVWWGNKDTNDISASLFRNGELYGSYSSDKGKTWKCGKRADSTRNLTNSPSPNADAGACDNDIEQSLYPYVYNNKLHIQYMNDKDAGQFVAYDPGHGALTENPMLYLAVPTSVLTPVSEVPSSRSLPFALFSARPNPFSQATTISYQAGANEPVRFTIFDVSGRAVRNLFDANPTGGIRKVRWDGRDAQGKRVPEGVYFYTVKAGTAQATGKILSVR